MPSFFLPPFARILVYIIEGKTTFKEVNFMENSKNLVVTEEYVIVDGFVYTREMWELLNEEK